MRHPGHARDLPEPAQARRRPSPSSTPSACWCSATRTRRSPTRSRLCAQAADPAVPPPLAVLVGPEGGFAPEERAVILARPEHRGACRSARASCGPTRRRSRCWPWCRRCSATRADAPAGVRLRTSDSAPVAGDWPSMRARVIPGRVVGPAPGLCTSHPGVGARPHRSLPDVRRASQVQFMITARQRMARDTSDTTPLTTRDELIDVVRRRREAARALRDRHRAREDPVLPRRPRDPCPMTGERGIRALLEGLARETGWEPILERGHLIGLAGGTRAARSRSSPADSSSSRARRSPTCTRRRPSSRTHLAATKRVADRLGIGFLDLGMSPKWTRAETPVMPKSRYRIMAGYMPKVGTPRPRHDAAHRHRAGEPRLRLRGRHGAPRCASSLALQPVATALFANSPFTDGRPNGFLSRRSEIWRDTDRDRTGMLPLRLRARASATRPTSTGCSTCRCTSSSAATPITTSPAPRSAT